MCTAPLQQHRWYTEEKLVFLRIPSRLRLATKFQQESDYILAMSNSFKTHTHTKIKTGLTHCNTPGTQKL